MIAGVPPKSIAETFLHRFQNRRGRVFRALPSPSARGAFFSGERGRKWAAGDSLMMIRLLPPSPFRLTAATLRDRGAAAGAGVRS